MPQPAERPMRLEIEGAGDANVRQHRIAVLAKRLMASAPIYDCGLPFGVRPFDREGCEDLALAVAFLAHQTGADITEYSTLHQLDPEALHEVAPRLVAAAWRPLVAREPTRDQWGALVTAETAWHHNMALQIEAIGDICPREAAQ